MTKVIVLCPYPHGQAPSQRFRFEMYFGPLKEKGCQIEQLSFWSEKSWEKLYSKGNIVTKFLALISGYLRRFKHILKCRKADQVILHRELTPLGPPLFEWLLAKILKCKYIYDYDDAIWLDDKAERSFIHDILKQKNKISKIIRWSEKVTAGNNYLADYASKNDSQVIVLPTVVDLEIHKKLEVPKDKLCIGWTGTHTTMQYLEPLIPVIERLCATGNVKFRVISNRKPDFHFSSLEFIRWSKEKEAEDLNAIDIGVMPLSNDEWVKGKCGFKAIQYMALGIPSVISNVGMNKVLIEHGKDGFLCNDIEAFRSSLELLIRDDKLREELGAKAQLKVKNEYSRQAWSDKFCSLILN